MIVERISIKNVRNHLSTEIEFSRGLNIIYGLNGSGKTSILESISLCSFTKSFLPVPDASLINNGNDFLHVRAECRNSLGIPYKIKLKYSKGRRKEISSTIGDNLSPKDVIGEVPLVVLSPDFKSITFGAPQDRRQFLDRTLSQASKRYADDMITLKKCLRQRNNLLNQARIYGKLDKQLLESWTEVLIDKGTEIVHSRNKFINEFEPIFRDFYCKVSDDKEEVKIQYAPDIDKDLTGLDLNDKASVRDSLIEKSNVVSEDEIRRCRTLFGPQKDDVKIYINSGLAREIASQGQHKSLLVSIKFAEFDFLKAAKGKKPVILLDDIFSELDSARSAMVLDLVDRETAQTFITVTDINTLKEGLKSSENNSFFQIEDSIVKKQFF